MMSAKFIIQHVASNIGIKSIFMTTTPTKPKPNVKAYVALWAWMTLFGVTTYFLYSGAANYIRRFPKYVQANGALTENGKLIMAAICLPMLYVFSQLILQYLKRQKAAKDVLPKE